MYNIYNIYKRLLLLLFTCPLQLISNYDSANSRFLRWFLGQHQLYR